MMRRATPPFHRHPFRSRAATWPTRFTLDRCQTFTSDVIDDSYVFSGPPSGKLGPPFGAYALHLNSAGLQEPLMLPGKHVDDVHLPRIPIIGSEDVRHGLLERFTKERIMHEDNACVIRHFPVHDAGGDGLDHRGSLPMTEAIDVAPGLHGQFTVDLDADDPLVREHSRDQQRLAFARPKIDERAIMGQSFQYKGKCGPLAALVRPVFSFSVEDINFGMSQAGGRGTAIPVEYTLLVHIRLDDGMRTYLH